MGKIDIQTNEYMSDVYRFADLFNFFLYEGKQVIKPESLHELSETALALPYGDETGSTNPIQKYRDVFKMAAMEDSRAAYLLLGLEDQSEVHYAISVKNMLYDAAQYAKQVEDAARTHRNEAKAAAQTGTLGEKKKVNGAEFLSGFHKNDRLLPVITLVLHWSPDEWDGARSIHEMFTIEDETLLRFVPDYRINLLSPKDIADHDFGKFQTTLAEALQYVKYSKEKDSLERIINENPKFKHLDRRTADVINIVTGSNLVFKEGEQEVDMCVAITQMREESKAEGRAEGVELGILETIKNIMASLKVTKERAMEIAGVPDSQKESYLQKL